MEKRPIISKEFQVTYVDIPPSRKAQLPSQVWAAHSDFTTKSTVWGVGREGRELNSGETQEIRLQPGDPGYIYSRQSC